MPAVVLDVDGAARAAAIHAAVAAAAIPSPDHARGEAEAVRQRGRQLLRRVGLQREDVAADPRPELIRAAARHHATAVQHGQPVARLRLVGPVGGEQHRDAFLPRQAAEDGPGLAKRGRVEAGGGLVHEQD